MINPGLAPWALKEYRPFRAPCGNEYDVLTVMSARTYKSIYVYLLKRVRGTYCDKYTHLLRRTHFSSINYYMGHFLKMMKIYFRL